MEYGGNVRLKVAPSPSMAAVLGVILVGSAAELVSSGLAALIATLCPFRQPQKRGVHLSEQLHDVGAIAVGPVVEGRREE